MALHYLAMLVLRRPMYLQNFSLLLLLNTTHVRCLDLDINSLARSPESGVVRPKVPSPSWFSFTTTQTYIRNYSLEGLQKSPRCASGSASLSLSFIPTTMANYELNSTVPSPGDFVSFIEFSPNGRFLGVGDCDHSSVCVLDRRSGFHKTLSVVTPAEPTALVWETSEAFYVGLSNGTFIRYQIKIGGGVEMLERGLVNNLFHGTLPVTAMGLDEDSKTLVLSVGPGVFALRRVNATSTFHLRIPMDTNSTLT